MEDLSIVYEIHLKNIPVERNTDIAASQSSALTRDSGFGNSPGRSV